MRKVCRREVSYFQGDVDELKGAVIGCKIRIWPDKRLTLYYVWHRGAP